MAADHTFVPRSFQVFAPGPERPRRSPAAALNGRDHPRPQRSTAAALNGGVACYDSRRGGSARLDPGDPAAPRPGQEIETIREDR
jgi:hypothetical protein